MLSMWQIRSQNHTDEKGAIMMKCSLIVCKDDVKDVEHQIDVETVPIDAAPATAAGHERECPAVSIAQNLNGTLPFPEVCEHFSGPKELRVDSVCLFSMVLFCLDWCS